MPPSLRGRGKALDAHARLAAPLLSDLAMLHPDLWHRGGDDVGDDVAVAAAAALWRPCAAAAFSTPPHFLCTFHPSPRHAHSCGTGANHEAAPSISRIRMQWGSVQEATSILAALNYLRQRNAVVEEAGLQPLEALSDSERCSLPQGLPPIGASPDALVRWPDGRVEPLEVKNHAPFATTPAYARAAGAPPLEIRDPGPYGGLAVWHVPQLYLHMLCLGRACSSALFMSCSATRGINMFRLRRDDALMHCMLLFIARFNAAHGGGGSSPPPNFMWGLPGYLQLLQGLQRASREHVQLVAHIDHDQVQRGAHEHLFCD